MHSILLWVINNKTPAMKQNLNGLYPVFRKKKEEGIQGEESGLWPLGLGMGRTGKPEAKGTDITWAQKLN